MKVWKGPLALLALCASCAHGIGADREAAYYTCEGIIIDGAAENLEKAGYALPDREGDVFVETGWTQFRMGKRDGARETLTLRLKAEAVTSGVRFSIWEPAPNGGEVPWSSISKRWVEDDVYRTLLDKIRMDVCGTKDKFFARR